MRKSETKRRFGPVETKEQLSERIRKEREIKNKRKEYKSMIKEKNPNTFHFEYHSTDSTMTKRIKLTEEELKKKLKYVECEINRCRKKLENVIKKGALNTKILFDEDGEVQNIRDKESQMSEETFEESSDQSECENVYEKYISELKKKRQEILSKIDQLEKK